MTKWLPIIDEKEGAAYFLDKETGKIIHNFPKFYNEYTDKYEEYFFEDWEKQKIFDSSKSGKFTYIWKNTKSGIIQTVPPNSTLLILEAALTDNFAFVEFYLQYNGDINYIDNLKRNCLHFAVMNDNHKMVKILIKLGCDMNQSDLFGVTPLLYSINYHSYKSLKVLVKSGCKINQQDKHGNTALHYAVKNKNLKVIAFLLENGAHLEIANNKDKYPLDIAFDQKSKTIVQFLTKYSNIIYEEHLLNFEDSEDELKEDINSFNKKYFKKNYSKKKNKLSYKEFIKKNRELLKVKKKNTEIKYKSTNFFNNKSSEDNLSNEDSDNSKSSNSFKSNNKSQNSHSSKARNMNKINKNLKEDNKSESSNFNDISSPDQKNDKNLNIINTSTKNNKRMRNIKRLLELKLAENNNSNNNSNINNINNEMVNLSTEILKKRNLMNGARTLRNLKSFREDEKISKSYSNIQDYSFINKQKTKKQFKYNDKKYKTNIEKNCNILYSLIKKYGNKSYNYFINDFYPKLKDKTCYISQQCFEYLKSFYEYSKKRLDVYYKNFEIFLKNSYTFFFNPPDIENQIEFLNYNFDINSSFYENKIEESKERNKENINENLKNNMENNIQINTNKKFKNLVTIEADNISINSNNIKIDSLNNIENNCRTVLCNNGTILYSNSNISTNITNSNKNEKIGLDDKILENVKNILNSYDNNNINNINNINNNINKNINNNINNTINNNNINTKNSIIGCLNDKLNKNNNSDDSDKEVKFFKVKKLNRKINSKKNKKIHNIYKKREVSLSRINFCNRPDRYKRRYHYEIPIACLYNIAGSNIFNKKKLRNLLLRCKDDKIFIQLIFAQEWIKAELIKIRFKDDCNISNSLLTISYSRRNNNLFNENSEDVSLRKIKIPSLNFKEIENVQDDMFNNTIQNKINYSSNSYENICYSIQNIENALRSIKDISSVEINNEEDEKEINDKEVTEFNKILNEDSPKNKIEVNSNNNNNNNSNNNNNNKQNEADDADEKYKNMKKLLKEYINKLKNIQKKII